MRRSANFNPEWGYLAPAPNFMRTLRIVVVAAAVGATGGAAVVFSLIDRETPEVSVAARTLATDAPLAAAAVSAPALPPVTAQAMRPVASELGVVSTSERPAGAASLAESPAIQDVPQGYAFAAQRRLVRQQPVWNARPDRGPIALLRSPGAATNTIPPRSDN
ncbi:MAG: hypothetical protein KGI48_11840 [Hyphomicrobiales bacterium]|nr:hypothetical protein [Hyphomicrobiales bacterium]